MTTFRGLLTASLMIAAAPAVAAEAIAGRWGDEASCGAAFFSANAPLTVSNYAVRWRGDSCRVGRMYKTGDTVHIQALCWTWPASAPFRWRCGRMAASYR